MKVLLELVVLVGFRKKKESNFLNAQKLRAPTLINRKKLTSNLPFSGNSGLSTAKWQNCSNLSQGNNKTFKRLFTASQILISQLMRQ
jgi:hypothetical protein